MNFDFTGEIIYWRGPAPYLFVPVPAEPSRAIKTISSSVSYGWGVIPVRAWIGGTEWPTALFPKDGRYLVPIKVIVQEAEGLQVGDIVSLQLDIG